MSIYTKKGYKDRNEYLASLPQDIPGVTEEDVFLVADFLGPDEDFDGLISTLQDLA